MAKPTKTENEPETPTTPDAPPTTPTAEKKARRARNPDAPRALWVSPKAMKLVKTCAFMWNTTREDALDKILAAYGHDHAQDLATALSTLLDAE